MPQTSLSLLTVVFAEVAESGPMSRPSNAELNKLTGLSGVEMPEKEREMGTECQLFYGKILLRERERWS